MITNPTFQFVKSIIENMQGAEDDWQTLAMVISLNQRRMAGTYGYAYTDDGRYYAVASRPSRLIESFTAYIDSHFSAHEPAPVKLLVEFDRRSGLYRITFEDTDINRWQVTPSNIDTIIQALRPHFS